MLQALAAELLNSLTMGVAVLDENGTIIAVNEEWKRFARENGGDDQAFYVGTNYLAICESASDCNNSEVAKEVSTGIHDLLSGERREIEVEYPCHSPDRQRWFVARITRFSHESDNYLVIVHEDITARKLAEITLQETETTLSRVLESLPVGVWIMDQKGQIVHVNSAGKRIWAGALYVGPERFGEYKGWWLDTGRRIQSHEWAAARAIQKGETSIDEEIRIECFDGTSKIILNSGIPLRDATGNISGAIIVNQDITSRKQVEEELLKANSAIDAMNRELQQVLEREQFKARTDDLTGLSNRRHFFELSEQLFSVAQRYKSAFSLFIFDIDHFKKVNDNFGHQTGDLVLKAVARIARENTRVADVIARYGGEEFIVVLPNTGIDGAFAVAENIRKNIVENTINLDGNEVRVSVSAGIAEILTGPDSLEKLIHRADQALYEAKNAGRNCSRVFSPESSHKNI